MKESRTEIFFRVLGALFFFGYIAVQVFTQFRDYQRYPEIFTFFSWLNWGVIILLFFIFGLSYIIRTPAVSIASRPREIFLPLFCAITPFFINESPKLAGASQIFQPLNPLTPGHYNEVAIAFMIIGNAITLIAMFSLKRSFSIMTEARTPVFSGLYRWIRHPVYVGEILATIGFTLYIPSLFNIGMAFVFLICTWLRAYYEECKLTQAFPQYAKYKARTGGFFPSLCRSGHSRPL